MTATSGTAASGTAASGTAASSTAAPEPADTYCDRCGEPAGHPAAATCAAARALEPPRYCGQCRRRLVVQVTPTGWTARCSHHGTRTS